MAARKKVKKVLYWTKYKKETWLDIDDNGREIEREIEGSIDVANPEIIKAETEIDCVPDVEGFEVDMNGIEYKDYLSNVDEYAVMSGILYKKADLDAYK